LKPILEIKDLKVYYQLSKGFFQKSKQTIKAVNKVSLNIPKGQTIGLVGESGCGKTTLGRTILNLVQPTSGQIYFYKDQEKIDLTSLEAKKWKTLRKHIQMIFQDPYTSLNPRMTIRDIIAEPLVNLKIYPKKEINDKVEEIATRCNLHLSHLSRFPHTFSGGQRQRVAIARALILKPDFIVCDEPVSALDVSTQADILNLLTEFKLDFDLTYLFIGHDLSVVAYISDVIAVMYKGRLVETGPTDQIFTTPKHPYTQLLLSSVPAIDQRNLIQDQEITIFERNDLTLGEKSCPFLPRCPYGETICLNQEPELIPISSERFVACHLFSSSQFDQSTIAQPEERPHATTLSH